MERTGSRRGRSVSLLLLNLYLYLAGYNWSHIVQTSKYQVWHLTPILPTHFFPCFLLTIATFYFILVCAA